ncbi:transcriptional regulator [Actibacterium mucosum KCTC 23349]|uniref:Transcriptional regulator n=1 Tax=Actibacterium mucosum KCTC 23349 TaxID=1454373 RepID=A0A037ZLE1_9RHOB|nr:GntR family transcriptional regulator [Actibacterium mucosum]KAJ55666.1 transcriptional regulator [Actibacterium mucosum KCTC 23349]
MARTDERLKSVYNQLLDRCSTLGPEAHLPSELALATEMQVSRTVVRSALRKLDENSIIQWNGRNKTVLRVPDSGDWLDVASAPPTLDQLESNFFDWVLRFDVPAGTPLNVTKLARDFEAPSHSLQELLAALSRFGLVKRRARGGWELVGFTEEFALELSDFRLVLELNALKQLFNLPQDHPIWQNMQDLKAQHLALAEEIEEKYHDFSRLDEAFHDAISGVVKNRFVIEFQRVISLIFHYHYQWRKETEKDRNRAAISEHLAIIDAILARDEDAAISAAEEHLATAKKTLLESMRSHEFV